MKKELYEKIQLLEQIFVFGGIFGFIYEEIFYFFDLGYLVKRGITFGPWIPIYAFGAIFIMEICKKFEKNTGIIFLLGALISGILEFVTGYVFYHVFNTRLWDYNVEILNFGNIGGYICLRSVLFFGLSAVLLFRLSIPMLKKINAKVNPKIVKSVTHTLFALFALDILISCLF